MEQKLRIEDLLDPTKAEEHIPELTTFFEGGGTWQVLMGLSEEALEWQYSAGYALYEKGKVEEAAATFNTLTILNPYDGRYWFALGSSHYLLGDYEEAAQAYELSAAIDERSPGPKFQAAICLEQLGRRKEARLAYEEALALAQRHSPEDLLVVEARSRLAKLRD
ncbi:MAG: SycD/LcrH family type III secretion system chaperone [Parachlamydiales bacterium]